MRDLHHDAKQHALDHGITLPEVLYADGRIHRFNGSPGQKRDKDEWYAAHELENAMVVNYGSWREEDNHVFKSWGNQEPNPALRKSYEEAVLKQRAEERRSQKEAKEKALEIWNKSLPCDTHPYLDRKGIQPHGIRVNETKLVIPIFDMETDEMVSLQTIDEDGSKRFLPGGKVKGGYFRIGHGKDFDVAEGFATGASVHEVASKGVIIAFSAHNCVRTALYLKKMRKINSARLLQDLGHAGEKVAAEWKKYDIGEVVAPDWKEEPPRSDWNDLILDLGKDEAFQQLKPKRFPSFTMEEFLELPREPVEWSVENLFNKGSVNMISAPGGVGKSMVALHLAIAATLGKPVFKSRQVATQNVLLLDAELPQNQLAERMISAYELWGLCLQKKSNPEESKFNVVPWLHIEDQMDFQLNLYSQKTQKYLEPLFEENDLIIIDNLDTATLKGVEDDSMTVEHQWQQLWLWLRRWKKKGKTIIIIGHLNKMGVMRGTGKIRDDMDTCLQLYRVSSDLLPEEYWGRLSVMVKIDKGRMIPEENMAPFVMSLKTPEILWDERKSPLFAETQPWTILSQEDLQTALLNKKSAMDYDKIIK